MKQKLLNTLTGGVLRTFALLILILTLSVSAKAATEYTVFNADNLGTWTGGANGYSCTSGDFELMTVKNNATTDMRNPKEDKHIRLYGKASLTISSENVKMTKIVLTCTSSSYVKTMSVTPDTWTVSNNGTTITATNTAGTNSITLTNTESGQARISSIVITGEAGAIEYPNSCDMPTFNVENNVEVEVGSKIIASCGTKKSTVKIVDSEGETVNGETETAQAVYTVPNVVGKTITLTASASVQGADGILNSKSASLNVKVIALKPFDLLNTGVFEMSGSGYTMYNWTSNDTKVKYYAKAGVNNGLQINPKNSGNSINSGIVSVENPDNLGIEKIVVTLSTEKDNMVLNMSNTAGSYVENSTDASKASVSGASDGVAITPEHVNGTNVYTYIPDVSYMYFAITASSKGAIQITDIKVYYKNDAPVAPAVPEFDNVELKGEIITGETLKFKAVEGVSIWYKIETATPANAPMREVNAEGYTKYESPVTLSTNMKSVSFYAEDDATGTKSETVTYAIDLQSGIAGIAAESSEAVYYNLQGVRVDNPTKGLYIRVANGKSGKVNL